MRLPYILLTALSSLCISVHANIETIPYELIYFYYVYKWDYETGGRNMGIKCRKQPTLCTFVDFVRDVMPGQFRGFYHPVTADATFTPDYSNTGAISDGLARTDGTARNTLPIANQLYSRFKSTGPKAPFEIVLNKIQDFARQAFAKGGIPKSEVTTCEVYAHSALAKRSGDPLTLSALESGVKDHISSDVLAILNNHLDAYGWYDWEAAFADMDSQVAAGKITQATADGWKQQTTDFSKDIRTSKFYAGDAKAVSHVNALNSFQTIVRELKLKANEAGDAATLPAASEDGSRCDAPEVPVVPGSSTKKRSAVELLKDVQNGISKMQLGDGERMLIFARSKRDL